MRAFLCATGVYALLGAFNRVLAWSPLSLPRIERNGDGSNSNSGPMEVFEVSVPLRADFSGTSCQQIIVDHEFAGSYGKPYVGIYSPPPADCAFTTVIFNMSITSKGINYDRLGLLFLDDVEVWRTTTAMPTRNGIYWAMQKDVSAFNALLKSERKVIMQMDNIYNDVFTATWNVTITALYYNDGPAEDFSPAELILPLSTRSSAQNATSAFTLPDDNATVALTLPRNAARAVVSVIASGNGNDEFWFRSVPSEFTQTFAANGVTLVGHSPFREVQVLIDGVLAGVGWPFPTIFTGGINPALWVPVVGVHTYDLPSFEVDVTPWLGLLCDGNAHTFALVMAGYDSTAVLGTVNENWVVSGSLFVWLDDAGNQTVGTTVQSQLAAPTFQLTSNIEKPSDGGNASLALELTGRRSLLHSATITTSTGPQTFSWTQELSYSNKQFWRNMSSLHTSRTITQFTNGTVSFATPSRNTTTPRAITNSFVYPLSYAQNVTYPADDTVTNSTIFGSIDRALIRTSVSLLTPWLTTAPKRLTTRQKGWAFEAWNNTYYEQAGAIDPAEGANGTTEQWYSSVGPRTGSRPDELVGYGRYVRAADGFEPVLEVDVTYDEDISVPSFGT